MTQLIEIEVPDNANYNQVSSKMVDDNFLVIVLKVEKEIKPHKHAEAMARFQKDVEEHGEVWAIDHWQFRSKDHWIDLVFTPRWDKDTEYRRVIKIGNRKVSEPVTELKVGMVYYTINTYGFWQHIYSGDGEDKTSLELKIVRLTEEDAQELHEALLAILAGE